MLEGRRFEREIDALRVEHQQGPVGTSGSSALLSFELEGYFDTKLRSEQKVEGKTKTPLRPTIAVHVPSGYQPVDKVNVVLFAHGFKNGSDIDFSPGDDAQHYVTRCVTGVGLVKAFEASKIDAILIVPTLGAKSQTGGLANWVDELVVRAIDEVRKAGKLTVKPGYCQTVDRLVDRLVLAGHSGGHGLMGQILARGTKAAAAKGEYPPQILARHLVEIWGFDVLYGARRTFLSFLRERPTLPGFFYANKPSGRPSDPWPAEWSTWAKLPGSAERASAELKGDARKAANLSLFRIAFKHDNVPERFFGERVEQSQYVPHR